MTGATELSRDVIVIGGGVSGLVAADALAQAGHSYVVLEAQSILGGRAQTAHEAYGFLDLGAAYAGDQQNFLNMYLQRFGVQTFKVSLPDNLEWLYQHTDGQIERVAGDDPYAMPGAERGDRVLATMYLVNQLSIQVRAVLGRPWEALNAELWDRMTLAQWMDRTLTQPDDELTRDLLTVATHAAYSVEPTELSFLWFLHYAAAAGCFQNLVGVTSNPEGHRFVGGSRALVDALVAAIGSENIRLGEPVSAVTQDGSGVRVRTARGTYRARAAIVCMSPINSIKLAYEPPLEAVPGGPERQKLASNMPMGAIIKTFTHFKSPFWRARGLSGYALAATNRQRPLVWTLDNCWEGEPDPRILHRYSLMGFIVGDQARYFGSLSLEDRREAVVAHLCELFGPEAREQLIEGVANYHEKNWCDDAWAGGGPCGHARPGVLTACGAALRRPVGRVYWAGTELATEWCGYLSGAIESGISAATDVDRLLTRGRANG
jgi:monoamine oxidase